MQSRATAPADDCFSGGGVAFGLAYPAVRLRACGTVHARRLRARCEPILRIAPFNVASALLILVPGVLGGALPIERPHLRARRYQPASLILDNPALAVSAGASLLSPQPWSAKWPAVDW